jgi:putative ABC transport system permease protein
MIAGGQSPLAATVAAMAAGAVAGLVTAILNVRFGILHLLASILTMIALYSINIRVMGGPNIAILQEATVLTPFLPGGALAPDWPGYVMRPVFLAAVALAAVAVVSLYLTSQLGLAMRATGANPRMARAQGIRTGRQILAGMALSNALVGLAGALFAQAGGFADATSGAGTIIVGLAAVILGETLVPGRGVWAMVAAGVVGSVGYRIAVQFALDIDGLGLQASDLNLVTAILVGAALILPGLGRGRLRLRR